MKLLPKIVSDRLDGLLNQVALALGSNNSLQQMYSSQFSYGHREILLDYADIPKTALILGEIQHGVLAPGEETVFKSKRFRFGRSVPFYTWSSFVANHARQQGFKDIRVIGSPWCYLANGSTRIKTGSKVVVMPWHSTVVETARSRETIEITANRFRNTIGSSEAMVILYWLDFLNPNIRNIYNDLGFQITTIGFPGIGTYSEYANNDRINFLSNVRAALSEYDIFLTDGFASPLFYALDMGLNVAYVDNPVNQIASNPFSFKDSTYKDNYRRSREFLSYFMPEIMGKVGEPKNRYDVLRMILGRSEELAQENLKETLVTKDFVFDKLELRLRLQLNDGTEIET